MVHGLEQRQGNELDGANDDDLNNIRGKVKGSEGRYVRMIREEAEHTGFVICLDAQAREDGE